MTDLKNCPCKSGASFDQCCQAILSGLKKAETAEALMRSRYSAYVTSNVSYLLKTWHPSTRPSAIDPETIPAWYDLNVLHMQGGQVYDTEGTVEFIATALNKGTVVMLHEVSFFVKEDDQWLYVSGEMVTNDSQKEYRKSKVGRNSQCPCGSGKKFKKCCGS